MEASTALPKRPYPVPLGLSRWKPIYCPSSARQATLEVGFLRVRSSTLESPKATQPRRASSAPGLELSAAVRDWIAPESRQPVCRHRS